MRHHFEHHELEGPDAQQALTVLAGGELALHAPQIGKNEPCLPYGVDAHRSRNQATARALEEARAQCLFDIAQHDGQGGLGRVEASRRLMERARFREGLHEREGAQAQMVDGYSGHDKKTGSSYPETVLQSYRCAS